MGTIRIKDLLLRIIIGINDWEREKKQDVLVNIEIDYNSEKAMESDDINQALDYKSLVKKIISEVEQTEFFLVEKLAGYILNIIFENELVQFAKVKVDKPHAIRFAESVSFEIFRER